MKIIILILVTLFLFIITFPSYPQWTEMSGPNHVTVYSVSSSGNNLLAGAFYNGVFFSTDFGVSWTQSELGNYDEIYDFANSDGFTFATSAGRGMFKSTNDGVNWVRSFADNVSGTSIGAFGSKVFLGTNHVIYFSSDYGSIWNNTTFINNFISDLLLTDNFVFAATPRGLYYSTNNGLNWIQGELDDQSVNALDIHDDLLFAGTDTNGIFVSSNNGETWTQTALNTQEVRSIIHYNSNIFAGTWNEGVYHSSDDGQSWTSINNGLANFNVRKLTILGNYIFAATTGPNVWRRLLSDIIAIKNINSEIPENYFLYQNYPNPFNPKTDIKFDIKSSMHVTLKIFNNLGEEVDILVNKNLLAGSYEVKFDGSNMESGVYYYSIKTNNFIQTKRMVLLK